MPVWPFKKKQDQPVPEQSVKPQLQNKALGELSRMFLNNPGEPTAGSDLLDKSRFDFSISSLALLDAHLEYMRKQELDDRARDIFILRAGAYVGEVVRQHVKAKEWHWLDYKQAAAISPFVASLGMSMSTAAVLWDGAQGFLFPCGKVAKFLVNGPEDSVLFFAEAMIAQQPASH